MASYQTINAQCSNTELQLNSLIDELKNSSGVNNNEERLTKNIRDAFAQLRAKIQTLNMFARETRGSDETEEIHKMVEWHSTQCKELQKSHQRANLMMKMKQDELNRASLLMSSETDDEQKTVKQRRKRDNSAQASSAVTESLVELRQKLSSGLTLSEDTMKTLVNSSATLHDSKNEMQTIGSYIDMTTRLITKFGRREIVDKFLIMAGIVLFFSVVLYILKKRLIG